MNDTAYPNYDVVIIGRGIAGLTAALHAADKGASIAVVYHSPLCSSKLAYEGVFRFPENIDELETMVCDHGCGLSDPELLTAFFKHYRNDGQTDLKRIFSLSSAKPIGKKHKLGGPGILADLERLCSLKNITFINGTAIKISSSDQKVSAVQIYYLTRLVTLKTKSVIIAAGGGIGNLYHTTNNAPACCPTGISLALNAGARLRDLEFISYHPFGAIGCHTPDSTTPVFTFFNIGVNTKIYSNKTDRRVPMIEALIATRTASQNPHDNIFKIAREVQHHNGIHIHKTIRDSCQRINLSVVAHSLIGGIDINTEFMTNVNGLYAAGESAGGLNGAGRLPGMALLEGYMSGKQAGIQAADYAAGNGYCPIDPDACYPSSTRFGMFTNIPEEIKRINDSAIFVERTENDLRLAAKRLASLKSGIIREDLAQHIEYDLVETALIMIKASLMRKESRGNFFRKDFPVIDPAMQQNIMAQKKTPEAEATVFWQAQPKASLACVNDL